MNDRNGIDSRSRLLRGWLTLVFFLSLSDAAFTDTAKSVAAGTFHTCAVVDGGGVKCWGVNFEGQLGDGTNLTPSVPTAVCADSTCTTLLTGIRSVAGGERHTCAVTSAANALCWGGNVLGVLGNGTNADTNTPVSVCADSSCAANLAGVSAMAPGDDFSCALMASGQVKCWGFNLNGSLGDGGTVTTNTPVDVCADSTCATNLSGVTALDSGDSHACVRTATGGAKCWGYNVLGQVGDGTHTDRLAPVDVCADSACTAALSGVIDVAAAPDGFFTCALIVGGGVKCWGDNSHGHLGDGTLLDRTTPVDVCSDSTCATKLSGAIAISVGDAHSCALMTGGTVKCWGSNLFGQLGDGSIVDSSTPVDVCAGGAADCGASLSGIVAIAAGGFHNCALTTAGGIQCWGVNVDGELGDGTNAPSRTTPVYVVGFLSGQDLMKSVDDLGPGGTGALSQEQQDALNAKLAASTASAEAGRVGPACQQLGAFINQVNAFVNDGTLTLKEGQDLIAAVNQLRQELGC